MTVPLPAEMVRVLSPQGELVGTPPNLTPDRLVALYRWMVLSRVFSNRMVALQRQGRMGTFSPGNGQEAASVGLAAALQPEDWLVTSYRESVALFMKGMPMLSVMETWAGYIPTGYPADRNVLPIQIVLASQMQHAVGVAMALQYRGQTAVSVGVCGDGATSEGEFNEALNFAGAFNAPVVLVVQNNGWAISVPRRKQTAAEFIAHRGPGFGVPAHIVDGNDILAVVRVMTDCLARARTGDGPSLVELITYRMGAHTTADDPTKYRPSAELEYWRERDPITRFETYLRGQNLLDDAAVEEIEAAARAEIQAAVDALESRPPQDVGQMFDTTFAELTPQLQQQKTDLLNQLDEEAADA